MASIPPDQRPRLLERPLFRALLAVTLLAALGGGVLLLRARSGDGPESALIPGVGAPTPSFSVTPESGVGALDDQHPIKGQLAPDFALRDVDGKLVKLSDLRGKVVWVNFWATWCAPCKKELPDIQKVYDEKHAEGLEVLAVNWQEDGDSAVSFFSASGLQLPLLLDRSGSVYSQYRLQGLPDSFFVDRDGKIAALQFGSLSESKMRERLAAAGLP